MFRTITRLLFGGEEDTPQEVKCGEVLEEEWLLVSHQEAASAENHGTEQTENEQTSISPPPHRDTATSLNTDISVLDKETSAQRSNNSTAGGAITGSVFHPKALLEVTQLTSIQKAKAWADRHYMTRNAIQRQNRVRHGVHHHSFPLQQPGHRHLSH